MLYKPLFKEGVMLLSSIKQANGNPVFRREKSEPNWHAVRFGYRKAWSSLISTIKKLVLWALASALFFVATMPAWSLGGATFGVPGNIYCGSIKGLTTKKRFEGVAILWALRIFPGSSVTGVEDISRKTPYEPFDRLWQRRILVHYVPDEGVLTSKILTIDQCGNLKKVEDIESDL